MCVGLCPNITPLPVEIAVVTVDDQESWCNTCAPTPKSNLCTNFIMIRLFSSCRKTFPQNKQCLSTDCSSTFFYLHILIISHKHFCHFVRCENTHIHTLLSRKGGLLIWWNVIFLKSKYHPISYCICVSVNYKFSEVWLFYSFARRRSGWSTAVLTVMS